MTEEQKAAEARIQATALEQQKKEEAEALAKANAPTEEQVKIAALEKEKQDILVREANYKVAYLKEKKKNEGLVDLEESDDERIRRIYREEQARDRMSQIDSERDALLQKALKENQELRLARKNVISGTPTGAGASTEQTIVVSTVITAEQLAAFKAKGWSDKDIERYKRNLQKNTR